MALLGLQKSMIKPVLAFGAFALSPSVFAHAAVTSGTGFVNAYYQVDLAIPHGCDGADTYRIEVSIPTELTSIRAVLGELGYAEMETDPATGNITKLAWEKSKTDLLESDNHAYNLSFRTKLPETPFTTLYFPTIQYCQDTQGVESTAEWVGMGGHDHNGGDTDVKPAPKLFIYPERKSGWNQYAAPDHLHDFSIFDDAAIIWKGTAAYSSNPSTQALIEADESTSVLDAIHPGEEFWVKY